ncbi:hypothetical protein V1527DRAFT_475168 [Lipomyces starkeyi]
MLRDAEIENSCTFDSHFQCYDRGHFNFDASAHTDRERQLYQTALDFLVKNEPEQYLELKLSFESDEALEEQARNMYGNLSYPAATDPVPECLVPVPAPTELSGSSGGTATRISLDGLSRICGSRTNETILAPISLPSI